MTYLTHSRIKSAALTPLLAASLWFTPRLFAQEANPTTTAPSPQNPQGPTSYTGTVPVYRVTVVGADIPAINYFHRSGSTKIGFRGTSLLPQAKGSASVESERGRIVIKAKFEGLKPANSFGPEYLTYVLWAITPDGSPRNLGEILPAGSKNDIEVTTDLQSFGLIITAEPYFAVSQPSDVVIVQNYVLEDKTSGIIQPINAHAQLLPRGMYTHIAGQDAVLNPITRDERSPLELYEAANAIQIAKIAGADKYASEVFQQAQVAYQNAYDLDGKKKNSKQTITYAREAVQRAEDARIISIRKQVALEQQRNKDQAEQAKLEAQQSQLAAQQAAAEKAVADAQAAEARARAAEAAEEAAKSQAAAAAAQQTAAQATNQAEQMRERLKAQLNQVLETRETARGLIVNMSDVLFDTAKYTLKPDAREKLAKVSGILIAYPGLKVEVEGYTDNVGGDAYNQTLSENRATSVRSYLVGQGVTEGNVSAAGFGKTNPVADNGTAAGRAQNRRVQLVVSGQSIGVEDTQQPNADPAVQPPANPNQ